MRRFRGWRPRSRRNRLRGTGGFVGRTGNSHWTPAPLAPFRLPWRHRRGETVPITDIDKYGLAAERDEKHVAAILNRHIGQSPFAEYIVAGADPDRFFIDVEDRAHDIRRVWDPQ